MEIVYVNLGKAQPAYLSATIERSMALFPQRKHTLILDVSKPIKFGTLQLSQIQNEVNELDSKEIRRVVDTKFRMGYWNLTLERLFAVLNYQIKNNVKNVLHIETDVILLRDFPFEIIENCTHSHWCDYGNGHDVAAMLHIPDSQEASRLKNQFIEILSENPNLTDMQLLFQARKSGANARLFPSYPRGECDLSSIPDLDYCGNFPQHYIFDGLTYGMYLTGQDPRNNYGKYKIGDNSPYLNNATHINPRNFFWHCDEKGYIYAKSLCCGKTAILKNLHIHSKNIKLFEKNWEMYLRKLIGSITPNNPTKLFRVSAVYQLWVESINNGSMKLFFLNSPPVIMLKRIALWLLNRT